ncbi:MAG: 50S ribosomal protein L32 [Rubinisphaera brasiliensis]|uniref:Large ribosomal subunit protein bL32 n=1 Tax=Rubinisphaera brasiliensis (strain ATCC 49424 / DSM 5305 / JCM 21570 / IAM 15109 / NBRC 103401 / IFAM 1448) TaxID=756272 RepID=F0SPW1_RUBBR|nr:MULTISPECIES: 50S ribosomal protein L32 [Rubinisphaera]ADY60111.1 LSU ribosomal protein L32P [Rubinisphaera brasiliensis DSM 5305]MBB02396.1 50S ribosomal protein L32 [Planctomyces sp.]MBR9801944.1 50S ribosomal protein L32 [bacterium]
MCLPKRRQSKTRSRKRRSHNAIQARKLQFCSQCGQPTPSHTVCPTCGFYMGRTMLEIAD